MRRSAHHNPALLPLIPTANAHRFRSDRNGQPRCGVAQRMRVTETSSCNQSSRLAFALRCIVHRSACPHLRCRQLTRDSGMTRGATNCSQLPTAFGGHWPRADVRRRLRVQQVLICAALMCVSLCSSRSSAESIMLLSSLPAALLQSLMHSLQLKEILSLARCSKWTLECADSAFAWHDCPPLHVRSPADSDSVVYPAPSRFSLWLPLAVPPGSGVLSEPGAVRLLKLMQSWRRIVSLGWCEWSLSVERGLELLSHPSLQSVRTLGLYRMHVEWLAAVASLPCLSELDLRCSQLESSELLPLVHASALRSLRVSEDQRECLSVVMQLSQLTTLSVYTPRLNCNNFVAFCSAMGGLEDLTLDCWEPEELRSISTAALATGFSSLRSLRTLTLLESFDEQALGPVLHLPPSLRLLTVLVFDDEDRAAFVALMRQTAPLLRVKLEPRSEWQ